MTTYDRGQVPILDFHNPAGATFYSHGAYSYPMGNTRKRSITAQIGTTKQQHVELLLLGCGDIRNLLCTVSEVSQRKPQHRPKSVDFHLNDYDALILPRDAILLDIVSDINPDSADDVDFLWNVWNNMCLSESHYQRLKQVIKSLLDSNCKDKGCMIQFQDSNTEQECRAVWEDWLDLDLDVQKVKQERTRFNEDQLTSNEQISRHILFKLSLAICSRNQEYLRESSSLHEEVKHWAFEASTTDDVDHINPTLIRPFAHNWNINYNASPFEGYMPFTLSDIERFKSLTAVCKDTLALWVKHFQQFKQLHPVKVILWSGDGLGLCTSGLPSNRLFDVIDTSNVSDHIGLLNVLVCCSPRLKRPLESLLMTSSMLCWGAKCKDMEDYYNKCIGIDTNILPTILGVQLAVDLDLGNRKIPDDWEETLYWIKASTTRTKLTIDKESDVITALWNLTKRCFSLIEDDKTRNHCSCGADLSSPLTLLRIIHQMGPLIEGGASRIMDLLERELPYDFYQEHGFSWKLVKSIAMRNQEPVLQVTVPVNLELDDVDEIDELKGVRSTPMVVFLRSRFDHFLGDSFDCCPVLYNSIRFNVQEGKVTFHMLKKDWNNSRKTWLSVIQDKENPLFAQRPISLNNHSRFDVRQVDPIETFGLFAVQEFEVFDSSSPLLQLIKVQEEGDSYYAVLAILDANKCSAKDMTVNFSPISSPTQIKLNFQDQNGSTLYFSCPVAASSKFQLSKKNAKLVCEIKKMEHYVTGEMALGNPAQVPFHVMSSWDPKEDDIEWTFIKMFRDDDIARTDTHGTSFCETRRLILTIFRDQLLAKSPTLWEITTVSKDPTKGLLVKVFNEIYKWNNLPYVKCIFHDIQKLGREVLGDVSRVVTLGLEFMGCQRRFVVLKEEEFEMIRRILYINAARTEQDTKRTSDWTDSFIAPVCARETHLNQSPDTLLDVMMMNLLRDEMIGTGKPKNKQPESEVLNESSDETNSCAFCRKPSTNLKKCTRCKQVSYCNSSCQKQHWELEHKNSCVTSFSKQPQNHHKDHKVEKSDVQPQKEDPDVHGRCVFCLKTSPNLKKCTRCRKVSYCNSDCQRKHWEKEHKANCLASSTNSTKPPTQPNESESEQSLHQNSNEFHRCAFCENPSSNLKKCTKCEKVSYCSKNCQKQHWLKGHSAVCKFWFLEENLIPAAEDSSSSDNAPSTDLCDSCQKACADLKNCPTCKKITYCDKECQTSLW